MAQKSLPNVKQPEEALWAVELLSCFNIMNYIACYILRKREKLKGIPMTFTMEGESYSNTEYC